MKNHPSNLIKLAFFCIVLFFGYSCSKDSDLLADYVVENPNAILANSIVTTLANNPILIEPLKNETVETQKKFTITKVTPPKMGTAVVNEDNTITYTPDNDKTGTDEFDYSATVTNPDSTATTATGNVTVNVAEEDKTPVPADPNRVNFSKYGAVGDGKADDTKAIQAALDAESSLVANEGATYRITGKLDIDHSGDQTINFAGAKILTGSTLSYMIRIEKPFGITTLQNLEMDGNLKSGGGMSINSSFKITNVNIYDLYSSTQAVIAFYVSSKNSINWTVAELKNSSAKNMRPVNNGIIGDNVGTSRAVQWEVTTDNGLQGLIEDCLFERAIGEDGDVFFWRLQGFDPVGSNVKLTVNRSQFKYGTRRVVKTQGGNLHFFKSTFTGINSSDPDFRTVYETGGFISLGGSTYGYNEYINGRNFVFDECTFNGSDFDKRIIYGNSTYGIKINNSIFNNGTEIRMWRGGGALCVSNSTFTPGSRIYDINDAPPYVWHGPIVLVSNKGMDGNFDQYNDAGPPSIGNFQCVSYENPNSPMPSSPN